MFLPLDCFPLERDNKDFKKGGDLMERICSQCGCNSFHYNRNRMRIECNACGHPVDNPQDDQQMMQYDRTYSQAMSHLAAGNWNQTINILRPLLSQYPTEKRLYVGILRAATQDFTDIDLNDASNRLTASDAWDKLVRLNGVTSEMIGYSRRKYEKRREELEKQKNKILAWVFAAAFCAMMAAILFGTEHYFLALLSTGGLIGCLYKASQIRPIKTVKELTSVVPNYQNNPFV